MKMLDESFPRVRFSRLAYFTLGCECFSDVLSVATKARHISSLKNSFHFVLLLLLLRLSR